MSSPNHSKDPGKSHSDKNGSNNKEEKQHGAASHGSPNKWKHTGQSTNPMSHMPAGPSRAHQQTGGLMKTFKNLIGKEEHISKSPASVLPGGLAKNGTPDQFGGAGAEDILVGNGVLPNGGGTVIRHLNDDSGTDNYSDHESGSGSSGGGSHDSGRNSNQSPSESCAIQLHISALPENVLENIFSFLDLADIRNAALVCHEWNRVVGDENSEVWRTQCFRRMSREVVYSELLSSCPSFKAKLRAHLHAWNPLDCSRNIYVKPNGFTIHRNPVAQSTDGARGKIGFNRGRHAWEIVWEGPLGTVAVVGVATQQAEVRAQGYIALLGKDDQSWGWNLVENLLLHNGDSQGNYPVINNAPRYQVGERIRVILDCEDNTLSFEKNFEFLGVAFRGLPNREKLFPSVSAVYGNTEISMVYLGPPLDG